MQKQRQIIRWLFESGALRVSEPDHPFWYTSGNFGPYYINTHFLFGGEEAAKELLGDIEKAVDWPLALPRLIGKRCLLQYHSNDLYRGLIDAAVCKVKGYSFDLISGGERRDFFFSFAMAELLGVEHLSILKNGRSFLSNQGFRETHEVAANELVGRHVLHVADLVTEASSYFRAWLPAIQHAGAEITDTFAVVDRCQGGKESLAELDVRLRTLLEISPDFFRGAYKEGLISVAQEEQLKAFYEHPHHYMLRFLDTHPAFLAEEAAKDAKTAERVQRFRALKLEKD